VIRYRQGYGIYFEDEDHKGYFVLRYKAIECEVEIWELLKEQPRGKSEAKTSFLTTAIEINHQKMNDAKK
jgi:hypothetical protein